MKLNSYYNFLNFLNLKKFIKIKLLICDVDGVMSDGSFYIGNNEELKIFNAQDGYGIHYLLKNNIQVAIITEKKTKLLKKRSNNLGIKHIYQGQKNKLLIYNKLLNILKIKKKEIAYIGDDLNDLSIIKKVGLSIAVANAHPMLQLNVDYITNNHGGKGAIREVCDLILFSQGKLEKTYKINYN
ncbi:3-deoxy-manno-octulosonate-8-phosphatase KdsC [Candidatus Providencia siddallii]|uniref:3-deoxy-D-manno-octulosonate 8-phosphate phosphatase KdsC n=1 Tax=Candidatus Providencia siddallii TaxID=1715285 RepID=A0ABM9NPD5_9GAMM